MPIKQVVLSKSACFDMVIMLLLLASQPIFAGPFSPSLALASPSPSPSPSYVNIADPTINITQDNAKILLDDNQENISPSSNSPPDDAPTNNETINGSENLSQSPSPINENNYYNEGNETLSRDYLSDPNSPAPSVLDEIKGNEEVGPSPSSDDQSEDSNYSQQLQAPPMVNVDVDVDPAAMAQPSSVFPFNYKAEDEMLEFEQEEGSGSWDDKKHGAVTGVLVGLCVVGLGGFVYKMRMDKKRPHYYQPLAKRSVSI